MRLKKLHISNIASIQEAEINFDAPPLSQERLFLITGDTGTGKSTIIDCLCLALYGTTPRMKAARRADYESGSQDQKNEESVYTNDPRQLLRRGCGSADVSLTFDDDKGVPYIAIWHVHRAHKKPTGTLQDVIRTLQTEDGITPQVFLRNKTEIDSYITKLIGLDVNQFFRTVVLAQGKFAEFLEANDNEKSLLLEKMMGIEVYSQVGKKIYDITSEKKRTVDNLNESLKDIILLSPDELTVIEDERAQYKQEQTQVRARLDKAKAMKDWLDVKHQIEEELTTQNNQLNELRQQSQEPAFVAKRQLLEQWDATTEARAELKRLQEARRHMTVLEEKKPQLETEFGRLCAALDATLALLDNKNRQLESLNGDIASEAPDSAMYAAIGQIKSLMEKRHKAAANVQAYTRALQQEQSNLPKAEETVSKTLKAYQEQEARVKAIQERYNGLSIDKVNAQKDALNEVKAALHTLKEQIGAIASQENAIADMRNELDKQQQLLTRESATLEAKRAIATRAHDELERHKDWNTLLTQAHKSLRKGDPCPVCGHVIDTLLAPKSQSVLVQLQAQYQDADQDWKATQTRVTACEKMISHLRQQIDKADAELNTKRNALEAQQAATRQLLEQCGKTAGELNTAGQTDALAADIDVEIGKLNATIGEAQALTASIQQEHKRLTQAETAHHNAIIAHNNVNSSIEKQAAAIATCQTQHDEVTAELEQLLTIEGWQQLNREQADKTIGEIEEKAKRYQQMVTSVQQLERTIALMKNSIPVMEEAKRNIGNTLSPTPSDSKDVPNDLQSLWNALENKFLEWQTDSRREQETARESQSRLQELLAALPSMTMEQLTGLTAHNSEEIAGIRHQQQLLTGQIQHLQGETSALLKRQENHQRLKPQCDTENPEQLTAIIAQATQRDEVLNEEISQRTARLKGDEENRKLAGKKRELLIEAETVYNQWSTLNAMLGNADGAKFRKIALSYILEELLTTANEYLRRFNDRYELEAYPGSLTILVRDLLQGDRTAVTTLSGGESFMVSLALALALARMTGKVFTVDTIFIDEGFGTLSEGYLTSVMETLNHLYDLGGRRVGIISHVEALKEPIATKILVQRDKRNNTLSHIEVVG